MLAIGIDASTISSGVCVISSDNTVLFSETISAKKSHSLGQKLVLQREGLVECISRSKIYASVIGADLIAGIEDVYIRFTPKVYKALCSVRGVFLEVMASEGIPCEDVTALSARKVVLGTSHKTDKDKVFTVVNECFSGHSFRNHDETDAAAVAIFLLKRRGLL